MADERPPAETPAEPAETPAEPPTPLPQHPDPFLVQIIEMGDTGPRETGMTDKETPPAFENAPAPETPAEGGALPSSVDPDLISQFERGAPDDAEKR